MQEEWKDFMEEMELVEMPLCGFVPPQGGPEGPKTEAQTVPVQEGARRLCLPEIEIAL